MNAVSRSTSTCQENALLIRFLSACATLSLIITLKKPKVMHQGFDVIPRVWENRKLTTQTKVTVYRAGILSALLYGSEVWKTYGGQEKRLYTPSMWHAFAVSFQFTGMTEYHWEGWSFHFTPCSDEGGRGGWTTLVEWRTSIVVFQRTPLQGNWNMVQDPWVVQTLATRTYAIESREIWT